LGRLAQSSALCLFRDGKLLHRNMRQEMLTEEELMSKIREQGLEDLSQVKEIYMEGDGTISVIKREQ
ncbi:MAG: YetF domain-containing protein, partial [Methylobacter sp.]